MPDIAGARAVGGQKIDDRHFERVGDGFEHDHRRIALPAFDLRQIAFGNSGIAGQLPARDAALGAAAAHELADLGGECVRARA